MTKQEFIAKYEGWFSYTRREELKKQMENDLEAVFQKLNESQILEESKQFNCKYSSIFVLAVMQMLSCNICKPYLIPL